MNLIELINFYSPWNRQKTYGFLMILGLLRLNSLNIRCKFWRQFLIQTSTFSGLRKDCITTDTLGYVCNPYWNFGIIFVSFLFIHLKVIYYFLAANSLGVRASSRMKRCPRLEIAVDWNKNERFLTGVAGC